MAVWLIIASLSSCVWARQWWRGSPLFSTIPTLRASSFPAPPFDLEIKHATHPVRFFLCFPHTASWGRPLCDWWHYSDRWLLARVSIRWLPGQFHACSWRRHEDRRHGLGRISRVWSLLLRSGPVEFKLMVSDFRWQHKTDGTCDRGDRGLWWTRLNSR